MNTKLAFALLFIVIALVAIAFAPANTGSSALVINAAQRANNETVALVPVTGESAPDYVQDARAYPSQKIHSSCASENNLRQDSCIEQEPGLWSGSIFLSSNSNAGYGQNTHAYPSQKLHSACVSEDSLRQDSCME
jgi:hypothetical protein